MGRSLSETVVHGGGGNGRVAHGDTDLVQRRDHVADRVKAVDIGFLMRIDEHRARIVDVTERPGVALYP